jgi:hypothetical protein
VEERDAEERGPEARLGRPETSASRLWVPERVEGR